MPFPSAAPHPFTEIGHPVQHGVNERHDVPAIDDNRRTSGRTQRNVQDRTIFGDVDLAARKHRNNPLLQAGFSGKLDQKMQCLVGNPILRIVEVDTEGGSGQAFAASRVVREPLAQMQFPNLPVMRFEGLPGGTPDRGAHSTCRLLSFHSFVHSFSRGSELSQIAL